MHILIGLTYYRPHYSGLTIYTERLARGLVKLGHQVTVLTSRFDPSLPSQEVQDGVRIIRPWVMTRLSKGVIMPALPLWTLKLMGSVDAVNLHMPQMDAAYISWLARLYRKPVLMTYHCDLTLPKGTIHWIANQGSHLSSHLTALASNVIVTNTKDYAENSSFLRRYMNKMRFIPPPVELPRVNQRDVDAFRRRHAIQPGERVIGMNARLATEKGVEYLIGAMPEILKQHPNARVLHVGQYQNVLGEEQYAQKLAPLLAQLGDRWSFLGVLPPIEQAAFFHAAEVMVLPSINSTESFGMVQVEAMSCGTPAVASDLPGVRCAVRDTGMGKIVPPRDPHSLAQAVIEILDRPDAFNGDREAVRRAYSTQAVARQYETLFQELTASK